MKYVLMPALQQMALVKIAAELWNQNDIRERIKNFNFYLEPLGYYYEWPKIEAQIEQKTSRLPSPEPLKKKLLCIIRPIGCQIKAWCRFHYKEHRPTSRLPKQFSWIPQGAIDWKRTAEMLVKDEDIEDYIRDGLIHIHCLGNETPEMWTRNSKRRHYSPYNYPIFELFLGNSPLENAIHRAIRKSNPLATEFFFDKLSDEKKDTHLVEYAEKVAQFHFSSFRNYKSHFQVFYFFLSRMTQDQQIQTLTMFSRYAFSCLLSWPHQPFFIVSAEPIVNLITAYDNGEILALITTKIVERWTDFDYQLLFRDYWRLMPLAHKKSSITHNEMLDNLLVAGEVDIVKLLFNEAEAIEKEKLIFSNSGKFVCAKLVNERKWDSLELFVEQCVPSKEGMIQLKEDLLEHYAWCGSIEGIVESISWGDFSNLLDHLIAKKSQKGNAEFDNENLRNNPCTKFYYVKKNRTKVYNIYGLKLAGTWSLYS